MATTIETTLTIQKALFERADALAQSLNIAHSQLFERAIAHFIEADQSSTAAPPAHGIINRGAIYWVQLSGDQHDIPHPHVVVQDDVFNHSRIHTVVVCALTSNIGRVNMPGNVLLEPGEANLSRQSVVEVSKVSTVDKTQLGDYIGSLSQQRIHQILVGMRFLQTSFFNP